VNGNDTRGSWNSNSSFTIISITFLPLSFVTSDLGMNTADIRDMSRKKNIFLGGCDPIHCCGGDSGACGFIQCQQDSTAPTENSWCGVLQQRNIGTVLPFDISFLYIMIL
jgi:hypothetical protein